MAFSSSVIVGFRIFSDNWMRIRKHSSGISTHSKFEGMSNDAADALKLEFYFPTSCLTLFCIYQIKAKKALVSERSVLNVEQSIPSFASSKRLTSCLKFYVKMLSNYVRSNLLSARPAVRQFVFR